MLGSTYRPIVFGILAGRMISLAMIKRATQLAIMQDALAHVIRSTVKIFIHQDISIQVTPLKATTAANIVGRIEFINILRTAYCVLPLTANHDENAAKPTTPEMNVAEAIAKPTIASRE